MKLKIKKKFLIAIITIAILLFIGLYFIINYREPNVLDSNNKKWIQENRGKLIDISIVNDISEHQATWKSKFYHIPAYGFQK